MTYTRTKIDLYITKVEFTLVGQVIWFIPRSGKFLIKRKISLIFL